MDTTETNKFHHSNNHLFFDLSIEVLHGCKWNCSGCNADKNGQNGFIGDDLDRLINLTTDLEESGYVLLNANFTPTDFMTSTNTKEVFNESIRPLVDKFDCILLTTTFLESDEVVEEWADYINEVFAGLRYKVAVPIEMTRWNNEAYLDKILTRRDRFVERLTDMHYLRTFVVANLQDYKDNDPFMNDNHNFTNFTKEFEEKTRRGHLDLALTEGRLPLDNEFNKKRLLSTTLYMRDLFNDSVVDDESKQVITFTYGIEKESRNKRYTYRNGELYAMVGFGDAAPIFHESMVIPHDEVWNVETIVEHETKILLNQLEYAQHTNQCQNCEFLGHCAARKLLQLMEICNYTKCAAPKAAFEKIRDKLPSNPYY